MGGYNWGEAYRWGAITGGEACRWEAITGGRLISGGL